MAYEMDGWGVFNQSNDYGEGRQRGDKIDHNMPYFAFGGAAWSFGCMMKLRTWGRRVTISPPPSMIAAVNGFVSPFFVNIIPATGKIRASTVSSGGSTLGNVTGSQVVPLDQWVAIVVTHGLESGQWRLRIYYAPVTGTAPMAEMSYDSVATSASSPADAFVMRYLAGLDGWATRIFHVQRVLTLGEMERFRLGAQPVRQNSLPVYLPGTTDPRTVYQIGDQHSHLSHQISNKGVGIIQYSQTPGNNSESGSDILAYLAAARTSIVVREGMFSDSQYYRVHEGEHSLLFLVFPSTDPGTITAPAGWTLIDSHTMTYVAPLVGVGTIYAYRRTWSAADVAAQPQTWTFSWPNAARVTALHRLMDGISEQDTLGTITTVKNQGSYSGNNLTVSMPTQTNPAGTFLGGCYLAAAKKAQFFGLNMNNAFHTSGGSSAQKVFPTSNDQTEGWLLMNYGHIQSGSGTSPNFAASENSPFGAGPFAYQWIGLEIVVPSTLNLDRYVGDDPPVAQVGTF